MSDHQTSGVPDLTAVSAIMGQVISSLNTVQGKLNEYYEAAMNDEFDATNAIADIQKIVSELVNGIQNQVP
ncbi:MAG: hypothetical protein HPY50_22085 [Firmicutes bacterium]|nr:hypothetical protein [Bacillota bacterium]